jgi:type I restriction enzyme M protein
VLQRYAALAHSGIQNLDPMLRGVSGQQFYNTAPLTFGRGTATPIPKTQQPTANSQQPPPTAAILDDPNHVAENLRAYIAGFSAAARDIMENFGFDAQITRLDHANLLYEVVGKFAGIDLHPDAVSNVEMGYLYEQLIRKFSELSNETAGEHFTPREVIRLMVNLLFIEDDHVLRTKGAIRTLFDPAAGTGGMLSVAEDYLRHLNPDATLNVYGEELNPETYAVCRSDMMLKGQDASNIRRGNSFSEDRLEGDRFDYMLANPPFGVEWKKVEPPIRAEAQTRGLRRPVRSGTAAHQRRLLPLSPAHDLEDEAGGRSWPRCQAGSA